jgi:preprotein translocase subunit SecF
MNNKGQSLVTFVIIIPIFIILLAFVVDTGLVLENKTKASSTIRTILKTTSNDEDKIRSLLEKNNIPTTNLKIDIKENEVIIKDSYEIESIFGKIIGIKSYKIKVSYKKIEEYGNIIIEKE